VVLSRKTHTKNPPLPSPQEKKTALNQNQEMCILRYVG